MERRMPKPAKVALIIAGVVVGLVIVAVVAVNIYMRATYGRFYQEAREEFPIPGTGAGFVVQDLDHMEGRDLWLFSGYMADGSPSPVYRRAADGSVSRIFVDLPDGTPYDGHGGGITSDAAYVFLTCDGGYLAFDASEIADAQDGTSVRALGRQDLDFSPAFLNIEGDTLYTGNFHYPGKYDTPDEHHITTPDGSENPAVMYAYPKAVTDFGYAAQAQYAFSIPTKVQGMCITPSGRLVLSTSWGTDASHLLSYDMASLVDEGSFIADGRDVPLYYLDSNALVDDLAMPPMSEGIELLDGRVYVTDEAASSKYLFGRLYGFDDVYSIEL